MFPFPPFGSKLTAADGDEDDSWEDDEGDREENRLLRLFFSVSVVELTCSITG